MRGVLFSFSGLNTKSSVDMMRGVERLMNQFAPRHDYVFLDSPLPDLEHPLAIGRRSPLESLRFLREQWALLEGFCATEVKDLLDQGKNVVVHRFGFDAALAAWSAAPEGARERIFNAHFALVRSKLKPAGIPAPIYVVGHDTPMAAYAKFIARHSGVRVSQEQFGDFYADYQRFKRMYFGHDTQSPARRVDLMEHDANWAVQVAFRHLTALDPSEFEGKHGRLAIAA